MMCLRGEDGLAAKLVADEDETVVRARSFWEGCPASGSENGASPASCPRSPSPEPVVVDLREKR